MLVVALSWRDLKMGKLGLHGILTLVCEDADEELKRVDLPGTFSRAQARETASELDVPLEFEHRTYPREQFLPRGYYEELMGDVDDD